MHPSIGDDEVAIEMPRYQSHKKVWALKIKSVESAHADGHSRMVSFEEEGYAPVALGSSMFARYTPVPGDYYVVYDDGYKSFSPAKAFEEGYTKI